MDVKTGVGNLSANSLTVVLPTLVNEEFVKGFGASVSLAYVFLSSRRDLLQGLFGRSR